MKLNLTLKENIVISSILLILFALLAIPYLGSVGLWNPLEPRYAAIAKEMFFSRDWFVLKYIDRIYIEKPPLFFWLLNFSYLLTGHVSSWSSRIPSIIATLFSLIGLFCVGKRLYCDRAAWFATAIFLLNFRTLYQMRRVQMESILMALIIWAIYFLLRALENKEACSKWLTPFYLFLGLTILFKGLVAFIPLLITLLIIIFTTKDLTLKDFHIPKGLFIILLLISSLWLVPALLTGLNFSHLKTLLGIGVGRFLSMPSKHGPFYYFQIFFIEFFPWCLLFPFAAYSIFKKRSELFKFQWYLPLIWFAVTLSFFMLNNSRHSQYIMPLYPAAALIIGWYIVDAYDNNKTKILNLFRLTLGSTLIIVPLLSLLIVFLINERLLWDKQFTILSQFLNEHSITPILLSLISIGLAILSQVSKNRTFSFSRFMALFAFYTLTIFITYNGLVAPWFDQHVGGGLLQAHIANLPKETPLVTYGGLSLSESAEGFIYFNTNNKFISTEFPTGVALERLKNQPKTVILLYSRDIPRLEAEIQKPIHVYFGESVWKKTIVAVSTSPIGQARNF